MTSLKIHTKTGAAADAALEPHIPAWYRKPGVRAVGIVELALGHWAAYIDRVTWDNKLTITQLRTELDTVAKGLQAALRAERNGHGEDD